MYITYYCERPGVRELNRGIRAKPARIDVRKEHYADNKRIGMDI